MDIVIDGYNLMHAAQLAHPSFGPGGLQRARDRLAVLVQHGFTELELNRVTIVFDAKESPSGGEVLIHRSGLRIHYASAGTEADDLIEELVQKHSAPRQLLVVSSDHRLQQAARRRQATFIDSDLFLVDLERRRVQLDRQRKVSQPKPSPKHEGLRSPDEVDEWLKAFESVQPQEIVEQVEQEGRWPQQKTPDPVSASPSRHPNITPPSQIDTACTASLPAEAPPLLNVIPEDELAFWERRIQDLEAE